MVQVKQIAGILATRISCWINPTQLIKQADENEESVEKTVKKVINETRRVKRKNKKKSRKKRRKFLGLF